MELLVARLSGVVGCWVQLSLFLGLFSLSPGFYVVFDFMWYWIYVVCCSSIQIVYFVVMNNFVCSRCKHGIYYTLLTSAL